MRNLTLEDKREADRIRSLQKHKDHHRSARQRTLEGTLSGILPHSVVGIVQTEQKEALRIISEYGLTLAIADNSHPCCNVRIFQKEIYFITKLSSPLRD